jgi:Ser/Thr protein kinase RdoA (MazF antagonist)
VDFAALEKKLSSRGLGNLRRIVGGWQSLAVYSARVDRQRVVVKVFDPSLADRAALEVRLELLSKLAAANDMVCTPVPIGGHLVNEITPDGAGPVYAVAYDFADGDAPDVNRPDDAAQMGRVLAGLHASMAALPPSDLPELAAFPPISRLENVAGDLGVPTAWLVGATSDRGDRRPQLLHGDFSSKNVRVAGATWRIFDFDDCGYGPIELDLANSLYFVLFDAMTAPDPASYRSFRENLLGGYRESSGIAPPDAVLDALITRRVLALASWLADPETAPPGIRTAADDWRRTLRSFVRRYLATI